MGGSLPGSSVHGISQARILEWVAISFSRQSSWPRDWTHVSWITDGFFTTEPPGKSRPTAAPVKFTVSSLLLPNCDRSYVLKKKKKEKREKDSLRVSETKWSFTAAVGSEAVLDFHRIAISTTSSKFLCSSAFFCCSGTKPLSLRNWAPGALGLYQAIGGHNCPLMVIKVHTPGVLAEFHTSPFLPFCVAETSTPHDNQLQFPLPLP